MVTEQLRPEQTQEIPLTENEIQAFTIAQACLQRGDAEEGKQRLIEFITGTGTSVELIKAGSDPNVGSFFRNSWFPEGRITLVDTSTVPEHQKVYELFHEYMYLQLHQLALPNVQGIRDIENGAFVFASGLPIRVAADIELAQALPVGNIRESIIKGRTELLEKLQNPDYVLKKSRDFITFH